MLVVVVRYDGCLEEMFLVGEGWLEGGGLGFVLG